VDDLVADENGIPAILTVLKKHIKCLTYVRGMRGLAESHLRRRSCQWPFVRFPCEFSLECAAEGPVDEWNGIATIVAVLNEQMNNNDVVADACGTFLNVAEKNAGAVKQQLVEWT